MRAYPPVFRVKGASKKKPVVLTFMSAVVRGYFESYPDRSRVRRDKHTAYSKHCASYRVHPGLQHLCALQKQHNLPVCASHCRKDASSSRGSSDTQQQMRHTHM